jgi:hypothetical protein
MGITFKLSSEITQNAFDKRIETTELLNQLR